jgi:pantetheine-phosphate adenylyltransferase
MPRTALYAGSFDPVTNGHVDVIRGAAKLADRLLIAIGTHPGKQPLFPVEERLEMLRAVCDPIARKEKITIETMTFNNLVVAAAKRAGATLLIRGLRDGTDFDYEMQMAGMNAEMARKSRRYFCPHRPDPPDHRHFGAADRCDGRRCIRLRAGAGRQETRRPVRAQILIPTRSIRCFVLPRSHCCWPLSWRRPPTLSRGRTRCPRNDQGQYRHPPAPRSRARPCRPAAHARARGFYNNVPFHRVIDGFMAQTGDGQRGDGTGGSKYPDLKAGVLQGAVPARRRRHGAQGHSVDSREQPVLHHVRRCAEPERPIHRHRRSGERHGRVDK